MAGAEGGAGVGVSAGGTYEGEVEVGILELGVVGEDLVHEEGNGFVVIVAVDRVACGCQLMRRTEADRNLPGM